MSPQFLEKRTSQLSGYLQCLTNPETLQANVGLKTLLLQFLEPKVYEKGKKPLAKKVSISCGLSWVVRISVYKRSYFFLCYKVDVIK